MIVKSQLELNESNDSDSISTQTSAKVPLLNEVVNYYENTNLIHEKYYTLNGVRHGNYVNYRPDGTKWLECTYVNGVLQEASCNYFIPHTNRFDQMIKVLKESHNSINQTLD